MEQIDLDTLLAIIGNPTRRSILRKLVKEDHYPLQLSKELSISQQSIMKHLQVLEEAELVKSIFRKSDSGPPRKFYVATQSLTIVIDMSPEQFSEDLRFHEIEQVIKGEADSQTLRNAENLRVKLTEFMGMIATVNKELGAIAKERDELLARKEDALRYANNIINTLCQDYEQRKVLRYLINENDLSLASMSERLNMRESEVETVLRNLEKHGLLMINK
ncbi:MAG: helix-turn-helix domain-containing protein [Thermoplasmata archaeon]|nr:helix-turn-helix domain-containing protein [Thermoplasmata archaeon]